MFIMSDAGPGKLNIGGSGIGVDAVRRLAFLESEGEVNEETLLSRVPEIFEMEEPFHLMFITCREEREESAMMLMQSSPDQTFYLSESTSGQGFSVLNRRRLHRHDFYELLYVIEGDIYQNIEHNRHYYPAGSCCLLNPNVYHTEESYGNQRIVFLGMRRDFLENLIRSERYFGRERSAAFRNLAAFLELEDSAPEFTGKASIDFIPLESERWVRENIHDLIEGMLRIMQAPDETASMQIRVLILRMLCLLFDPTHYRHSPLRFTTGNEERLFSEITAYLKARNGRAKRTELVRHFHYSGDYLYKTVRKLTGLSLEEYGSRLCLEEALKMLKETEAPISLIISRLGFTNQTQFYRLFRQEYGMSPKEFRKSLT